MLEVTLTPVNRSFLADSRYLTEVNIINLSVPVIVRFQSLTTIFYKKYVLLINQNKDYYQPILPGYFTWHK